MKTPELVMVTKKEMYQVYSCDFIEGVALVKIVNHNISKKYLVLIGYEYEASGYLNYQDMFNFTTLEEAYGLYQAILFAATKKRKER